MIIDIIEELSDKEMSRFYDIAERYSLVNFHQSFIGDIYDNYTDAPYWGEGPNEYEYEYYYDPESYEDKFYNDWFNNVSLSSDEISYYEYFSVKSYEIHNKLLETHAKVSSEVTIEMLQWLNDEDIPYIIHRSLDGKSKLFIRYDKRFVTFTAIFYPVFITYPMTTNLEDEGWVSRQFDLTSKKWLSENCCSYYVTLNGRVWFYNNEDAVHYMLRWG